VPLKVRVVKSEWADPAEPKRDAVGGYLEVVEALAGKVPRVAVATHDPALAPLAFGRLAASTTAVELQVLYATNGRRVIAAARDRGVPVRIYIPYGNGRVPYATGELFRRPSVAARVAFDVTPLRPLLSRRRLLLGDR